MSTIDVMVNKHYGTGNLLEKIESGLNLAGKNLEQLTVDDLAPVDEFHTRGRESTIEIAEMAKLKATDKVLDVGCGLGGSARHLAEKYNCHVTGIDLTAEYITVGKQLTEKVGLSDKVTLVEGSALALPFKDNSFDVVWTEHAQMNIADKELFYAEISRVLKPGGRLVFHDIFRGSGDAPFYPAPWAEDASLSTLATESEAQAAINKAGLSIDKWIGKVSESAEFFQKVLKRVEANGPPPVGIHLLMGDNARVKLGNYVQNLLEKRVCVSLGIAFKG